MAAVTITLDWSLLWLLPALGLFLITVAAALNAMRGNDWADFVGGTALALFAAIGAVACAFLAL